MAIKREAAFHEAGHAITAYRSRFYNLIGSIDLESYGAGEIYVSLSKAKLLSQGKSSDPSVQKDKDVVSDLAVVLVAGLVAEQIAEQREPGLTANPACAEPDHDLMKQQLQLAGLSKKYDRHEEAARQLLEADWALVADLANLLFDKVSVDAVAVQKFIESHGKSAGDA